MSKKIWNSELETGEYTPVVTNLVNITATTTYQCFFKRSGDWVSLLGKIDVHPTTAATAGFELAIPIPSNFTQSYYAVGTIINDKGDVFRGYSDATNKTVKFVGIPSSIVNAGHSLSIDYRVL